jgi:hypothetical protein
MATKRSSKKRRSKKQGPAALRDLQALAKRLQRQLGRRRRLAAGTVTKLEKDLRSLTALLTKRANAVRTDVEKHLRGLRRDLARQAKTSAFARGGRKRTARKKK